MDAANMKAGMCMVGETRANMVRSAAVLLRQNGFRGTSFAKVLDHSDAPRGSIAHHFPGGKEEMIAEAVRFAGRQVEQQLQVLAQAGASGTEVVAAICSYFERGLVQSDFRAGCPVAAVAYEAYENDDLRQEAVAAIGSWANVLAGVLESEGYAADDAFDRAQHCIAAVEGAIMLARIQKSVAPLHAAQALLNECLGQ